MKAVVPEKLTRTAQVKVVNVIAGEPLLPGQPVGFKAAGYRSDVVFKSCRRVGVVDPLRRTKVKTGERCRLFLYPEGANP